MTRRERLLHSLQGKPVDRPAVNFYEVGGFPVNRADTSPFNIYNAPDWQPLLDLAESESDLIRMKSPATRSVHPELVTAIDHSRTWIENGARFHESIWRVNGRALTLRTRRDPDLHTIWTLEHRLKDADDARANLALPDAFFEQHLDPAPLAALEAELGDRGLVMVDTPDPLCVVASLFSMETYTVLAMTEPLLFHRLLEKTAAWLWRKTETVAALFPGRLWRIYGPEYAAEPYLPPALFQDYVVRYTEPMIRAIQRTGGFVRIHCHGRLKRILPLIAAMKPDALDPIEPPPQGDVELIEVRREYGRDLTLFGNLEASDLENLAPPEFETRVKRALEQGTSGSGRGFVLMPSASPYGRTLRPHTLDNYRTLVRLAHHWTG